METTRPRESLHRFRAPESTLGTLDAASAADLIAAAADVSLVIDGEGVIRDMAFGSEELRREEGCDWVGRRWIETVTVESRPKIELLLREAAAHARPHWRQVNHPSPKGPDIPILYSAVSLDRDGSVVAVGRDLRGVSVLQRKLVDAQASMEREYARLRHAETRYRLLFQMSSEAVLIVDASSRRIVEANPAAAAFLGAPPETAVGRSFAELFDAGSASPADELLVAARALGRVEETRLNLAGNGAEVGVAVSLFRQDRGSHFLVRLATVEASRASLPAAHAKARVLSVVEGLPDALVVTDLDRRILTANAAFLDLAQLPTHEQVRGEPLDRWLGRSAVDCNVLVASLREHGSVRHFGTVLRGEYGLHEEVEVAAVSVPDGEQPCYGFSIRSVGRRLAFSSQDPRRAPESLAHLADLVGRVSMKELVRETTDVIERMCIEAALELTGDNRASAAEMLGLSRQSFYAKLRRHGLGDLGTDEEA